VTGGPSVEPLWKGSLVKVLIDTNIVLDIALNRKPFVEHAVLLWRLAEQKETLPAFPIPALRTFFTVLPS